MQLSRGVSFALSTLIAAVIAWRILFTGMDALRDSGSPLPALGLNPTLQATDPERIWRQRLARNPADYSALLALALEFERSGKKDAARDAAAQVLRLAPTAKVALAQISDLYLRIGDENLALVVLQRYVELYPNEIEHAWKVYIAAMDTGRHVPFFTEAARTNARWWPQFFAQACYRAALPGVQSVFIVRSGAGLATPDERRCVLSRLQNEGQWTLAYQFWLNSLPPEQRQRIGYVFNGGFELPLSNLGFDWLISSQDDVVVNREVAEGATGQRALHVTFVNKRFTTAPVYQYLMLYPGRYRFEGRGRPEGLNTWLGVQWGLYCPKSKSGEERLLFHTEPLMGSSDWTSFHHDFVVARDCPLQVLRLEMASPRRDMTSGAGVAIRLRGGLWFDDMRVRNID